MPHVVTTSSNDIKYVEYGPATTSDNIRKVIKEVLIKGGATIRPGHHLHTPSGIVTHVTDQELEFLEQNDAFKRHAAKGFVKVFKAKPDPEKVAKDLEPYDGSSPNKTVEVMNKQAPGVKKADAKAK